MKTAILVILIISINNLYGQFYYNPFNEIKIDKLSTVSKMQQPLLWSYISDEYASQNKYNKADGDESPDTSFLLKYENIESPFITDMVIINNDKLLIFTPLDFTYELHDNNAFKYPINLYFPVKYQISLIKSNSGKILWENTYNLDEIFKVEYFNNKLLIISQKTNSLGNCIKFQLTLLKIDNGEIIWQKSEQSNLINYKFSIHDHIIISTLDSLNVPSIRFMNISDGSVEYCKIGKSSNNVFAPFVTDSGYLFVNEGISHYSKENFSVQWKEKDQKSIIFPVILKDKIFCADSNRIFIYDTEKKNLLWQHRLINYLATDIFILDDFLFVNGQKTETLELDKVISKHLYKKISPPKLHGYRKESLDFLLTKNYKVVSELLIFDLKSYKLLTAGKYEDELESVLGYFNKTLFFVSQNNIYGLNTSTGEIYSNQLPFEKKLSNPALKISNNNLFLINDSQIFKISSTLDKIELLHNFDLAITILNTSDVRLDIIARTWAMKKIGVLKESDYDYFNYIQQTKYITDQINSNWLEESQQMTDYYDNEISQYKQSGNYSGALSLTRSKHATQEFYNSLGEMQNAMASATMQIISTYEWHQDNARLFYTQHYVNCQGVQPKINKGLSKIRMNDHGDYIVRIVKKELNENYFIALEFFNLSTYEVNHQLLSPMQFNDEFYTFYTNLGKIRVPKSYYGLAYILPFTLNTIINWENKLVFHYGPGLDVSSYSYYSEDNIYDKCSIRSSLITYPLSLPDFANDE
jgi:hypothetical protein